MNFLLIAPIDPRETSVGGAQRTNFLYQVLSKLGTVYTVIPVFAKHLEKIDRKNRVAMLCIEKRYSAAWCANHFFSRYIPIMRWHGKGGKGYFDTVWQGVHFDFTVCRYTQWAAYSRAWKIAPLLLDIDDLPEEVFRTVYRNKLRMGWLSQLLIQWWSHRIFKKASGAWIANQYQVSKLPLRNKAFLPNLPQKPQQLPADLSENLLFSVGYLGYPPNYLGIDFFLEQVWPRLHRDYPELTYRIAGRELPEAYRQKWRNIPGVSVMGFVDNLDAEYERSLFSVAPIFSGSGTCIKVLESLAHHRCCLCSSFAARGLEETGLFKAGLLRADNADEFYHQAKLLIENHTQRKKLQESGAKRVDELFNFDYFSKQVEKIISNLN